MADPLIYADEDEGRMQDFIRKQGELKASIEDIEGQWMEVLEQIDEMEA